LSERSDWRVLLLEAGGEEPQQTDVPAFVPFNWESRFDWQYQTEPDEGYCGGKSCTWNAGKVLGGGSILNGMIYNRGNARSYDEWKEMGKDPARRFTLQYQSIMLYNVRYGKTGESVNMWEKVVVAYFKVLSWRIRGGIEENQCLFRDSERSVQKCEPDMPPAALTFCYRRHA
jgi:hypothetical protein